MRKIILDNKEVVAKYKELKSSNKVAPFFNVSSDVIKRILKEEGVLMSVAEASRNRGTEWKQKLSEHAKTRTGNKNPFYGKKHTEEVKQIISNSAKTRTGKRNSNYQHGNYKRREKDYKLKEFTPIRKASFERDNFTCQVCQKQGGNLQAHHIIPYWVCEAAYLDLDNLITCCVSCHKNTAHKGDYARFNVSMINDSLIAKYFLDRERLNELADFNNKKSDAIV